MTFKSLMGATCACLAVVSFSADAALVSRLGGLAVYDTDSDLTWLADANYARTSGYNTGSMDWIEATTWAGQLNIEGIADWRLPTTLVDDLSCSGSGSLPGTGFGCSGSEMGNLFYNVMGGGGPDTRLFTDPTEAYLMFSNIQARYWSSTNFFHITILPDTNYFFFDFAGLYNLDAGEQRAALKFVDDFKAWAVHDGDVSLVPVPAAAWLFGSGLIGLVGLARRQKA